jgi:thiosulfate/3-mercaptopyruvate sulfurtransferase
MMNTTTTRNSVAATLRVGALLLLGSFATLAAGCGNNAAESVSAAEPWGTNTMVAADLVKELATADKPVVVCTAPTFLYRTGHVPGAVLHGPASSPSGLDELAAWAKALDRSTNLVIYCGCCPLEHCPNLRPAYAALKGLGFKRLRVLVLPNNFGTDWVDRGYPVER